MRSARSTQVKVGLRRALLLLGGMLLVAGNAGADPLAIGRRIYREGLLPSGQPLRGIGQAQVVLSGTQAACTTCHRRSGYGSSEGPIEVRAITGPALFGERVAPDLPGSPAASGRSSILAGSSTAEAARASAHSLRAVRTAQFAGNRPRPAYDDAALAKAIREGVDASGHVMNASMPRYVLDGEALESLTAYLKSLSVQAAPGVTAETVHFATVVQPDTDPKQRQALVDVLQTYLHDRNRGQRAEIRREQAGLVRLQRTYREWVLHVWDLSGPRDTWGAQLEAYNRQQPVFAMVSGLGKASWRPIHEFSERFEVPCIFPQVDVPELDAPNFYTVYLSRGMTLEAQALAKYLRDAGERGPVMQVYRRDEASATGAAAFREAWAAGTGTVPLEERVLDETPGGAFWQQLAQPASGATLVLWLKPEDLVQAQTLTAAASPVKAVYLSSSLVDGKRSGIAADAGGRVRLVYPQDAPVARETRLALVKRWLLSNGLALTDEKVQMNAYLAATVTAMVVSHSMDTYSREFVLERMEHRLGTALEPSIYPHMSLGPGQRFASKGSYIVGVGGEEDLQLTPVSGWIVP
ncbi:MAG: hypothetical protein ABI702_02110 [Burkholderiales bacterium]